MILNVRPGFRVRAGPAYPERAGNANFLQARFKALDIGAMPLSGLHLAAVDLRSRPDTTSLRGIGETVQASTNVGAAGKAV
jgi:hypothetical protein